MGHMFGWPLPGLFLGDENVLVFALTQFLLLLPVIFVNFKFFRVGFKTLVHGAPNMDSLIALGSTRLDRLRHLRALHASAWRWAAGDMHAAHLAAMDLYFESAAMILTLITLGKYFEARAKGKTTDAITKLHGPVSQDRHACCVDGVEETVPVEQSCVRATSWWCAPEKPCRWTGRCSTASALGRRVGHHGRERAGGEAAGRARSSGATVNRVGLVHHARRAAWATTPPWRGSSAWWTRPPAPRRPSRS